MGLSDLPLANAEKHAACFERLGWTRDYKRRGRGVHILLTKKGERATLSIPIQREVKRTIIAGLIRAAGITQEKYIEKFYEQPLGACASGVRIMESWGIPESRRTYLRRSDPFAKVY